MKKTISKPITFGELKIGELFIDFPTDGDDNGHGGFRQGFYVFEKTKSVPTKIRGFKENAKRLVDGNSSYIPDTMEVIKVLCLTPKERLKKIVIKGKSKWMDEAKKRQQIDAIEFLAFNLYHRHSQHYPDWNKMTSEQKYHLYIVRKAEKDFKK